MASQEGILVPAGWAGGAWASPPPPCAQALALPFRSPNPFLQLGEWCGEKDEPAGAIRVARKVYLLRTTEGRYVKLQFKTPETAGNVKFRWKLIGKVGENRGEVVLEEAGMAVEEEKGRVVVQGDQKLESLLAGYDLKGIRSLVLKKKLSQLDLNFIKKKMGQDLTVDMTESTLYISDSEYGFKDNKNIKKLLLPRSLGVLGQGQLGYTHIESVVFTGDKL